jgi:hypothetical protein
LHARYAVVSAGEELLGGVAGVAVPRRVEVGSTRLDVVGGGMQRTAHVAHDRAMAAIALPVADDLLLYPADRVSTEHDADRLVRPVAQRNQGHPAERVGWRTGLARRLQMAEDDGGLGQRGAYSSSIATTPAGVRSIVSVAC